MVQQEGIWQDKGIFLYPACEVGMWFLHLSTFLNLKMKYNEIKTKGNKLQMEQILYFSVPHSLQH